MRARTDDQMRAHLERNSVAIPIAGCWIWLGGLSDDGYGQATYKNRNVRAHRLSWLLHGNAAAPVLMHRCDTPACINPHHLMAGTSAENTADKMRKNRHRAASGDAHYMRLSPELRSGERAPHARLTADVVRAVRDRIANGERQEALAKEYGVTRAAISAIAIRRTWKHI